MSRTEVLANFTKDTATPGGYGVIYADPPWSYTDKCNSGNRGAGHKYQTMTDAELAALPVGSIAADDCALFMWATFPRLGAAIQLMADWGFTYKTCAFVWVKKSEAWKLAWGMGNWTRANAEIVLLGIKGKPKRIACGVHQIIEAPRREHSRKPDEARDRIVELMGDVPRIELFARQSAPGWESWGNESTKFDQEAS